MSDNDQIDHNSLFYTGEDFNNMVATLQKNLNKFLIIDDIRTIIAQTRISYFRHQQMTVSVVDDYDKDSVAELTIEHNLSGLADIAAPRSHFLLRPLISINEVMHSTYNGDLFLTVGPRSEGEILNMIGYGIPIDRIKALDLISCSPWIEKGDMHDMPYKDDEFSVILLGFVLGYSINPKKLVSEIRRVAKPGCIVAIGNEFNPKTNEELRVEAGYSSWKVFRYNTADDIINLFEDIIDKVLFQTEPAPQYRTSAGPIGVIFRVKK